MRAWPGTRSRPECHNHLRRGAVHDLEHVARRAADRNHSRKRMRSQPTLCALLGVSGPLSPARTQANRARHGTHAITIATWVASVAAGAALGAVIDIPTAIANFALTALFVYLLWDQLQGGPPARRAVRSSDRDEFPGFSCRMVAYIRGHPRMPHGAHICPSRARAAK